LNSNKDNEKSQKNDNYFHIVNNSLINSNPKKQLEKNKIKSNIFQNFNHSKNNRNENFENSYKKNNENQFNNQKDFNLREKKSIPNNKENYYKICEFSKTKESIDKLKSAESEFNKNLKQKNSEMYLSNDRKKTFYSNKKYSIESNNYDNKKLSLNLSFDKGVQLEEKTKNYKSLKKTLNQEDLGYKDCLDSKNSYDSDEECNEKIINLDNIEEEPVILYSKAPDKKEKKIDCIICRKNKYIINIEHINKIKKIPIKDDLIQRSNNSGKNYKANKNLNNIQFFSGKKRKREHFIDITIKDLEKKIDQNNKKSSKNSQNLNNTELTLTEINKSFANYSNYNIDTIKLEYDNSVCRIGNSGINQENFDLCKNFICTDCLSKHYGILDIIIPKNSFGFSNCKIQDFLIKNEDSQIENDLYLDNKISNIDCYFCYLKIDICNICFLIDKKSNLKKCGNSQCYCYVHRQCYNIIKSFNLLIIKNQESDLDLYSEKINRYLSSTYKEKTNKKLKECVSPKSNIRNFATFLKMFYSDQEIIDFSSIGRKEEDEIMSLIGSGINNESILKMKNNHLKNLESKGIHSPCINMKFKYKRNFFAHLIELNESEIHTQDSYKLLFKEFKEFLKYEANLKKFTEEVYCFKHLCIYCGGQFIKYSKNPKENLKEKNKNINDKIFSYDVKDSKKLNIFDQNYFNEDLIFEELITKFHFKIDRRCFKYLKNVLKVLKLNDFKTFSKSEMKYLKTKIINDEIKNKIQEEEILANRETDFKLMFWESIKELNVNNWIEFKYFNNIIFNEEIRSPMQMNFQFYYFSKTFKKFKLIDLEEKVNLINNSIKNNYCIIQNNYRLDSNQNLEFKEINSVSNFHNKKSKKNMKTQPYENIGDSLELELHSTNLFSLNNRDMENFKFNSDNIEIGKLDIDSISISREQNFFKDFILADQEKKNINKENFENNLSGKLLKNLENENNYNLRSRNKSIKKEQNQTKYEKIDFCEIGFEPNLQDNFSKNDLKKFQNDYQIYKNERFKKINETNLISKLMCSCKEYLYQKYIKEKGVIINDDRSQNFNSSQKKRFDNWLKNLNKIEEIKLCLDKDICENRKMNIFCQKNNCSYPRFCQNKTTSRNFKYKLENLKTELISEIIGYGVITKTKLLKGELICQFTGQIINKNKLLNTNYSLGLNAFKIRKIGDDYYIDANKKGNLARFINHSCNPNCESVNMLKKIQQKVENFHVIYARRNIEKEEELTVDYRLLEHFKEDFTYSTFVCLCSKDCGKIIPK